MFVVLAFVLLILRAGVGAVVAAAVIAAAAIALLLVFVQYRTTPLGWYR